MTALKPRVHQTVTPTRATHASGTEVGQGMSSGSPIAPRYWLIRPMLLSSRKRHSTATTATPRTYGAKYSARNRLRPGNLLFITNATINGTTSSNGTLSSVKMPVACMAFQKSENVVEPESKSFV